MTCFRDQVEELLSYDPEKAMCLWDVAEAFDLPRNVATESSVRRALDSLRRHDAVDRVARMKGKTMTFHYWRKKHDRPQPANC